MLDKMKYINSRGQTITFGEPPYFANYSDFRDYKWSYSTDTYGKRLDSFSRGVTVKKLPVVIKSSGDCTEAKNNLYNIIEYDVLYNSKGKLFIGDYYMEGFFFASDKSKFLESSSMTNLQLEFVSEDGAWKRKESRKFLYAEDENGGGSDEKWLTYPYDYLYDYKAGSDVLLLNNTSAFECDFIMRIYGQCTDPVVTIGNNDYSVSCTVYTNEFLEINSKEKTVIRYKPDGTAIDEFNNRSREGNAFMKIPAGQNVLRHNVSHGIDIELIDERSEPLWI